MTNVAKLKEDPPIPSSLSAAMAVAFSEIEGATKSANNPHFKTKYADLTAVIDAIKPALIRNGLFFTQCPEPSDKGVTVETVLHHSSGDSLSLGKLFVPANKQDAQGYGSALTYARRYALVTAFGVPVEDDDGNAASRRPVEQQMEPAKHDARKNPWSKFYSGRSALHRGLVTHEAELNRIGTEGVFDDLETYLTSPEYADFVKVAGEHMPHYLEGGPPAPEEFVGIFALEQRARDMIAMRGNVPATEPA